MPSLMAHFSIQFIIIITHGLSVFIEATTFVSIKEQHIHIVSNTLQVVISQVTTSSFQIRNIAITANAIADIARLILTNFIVVFVFY